uniref:Putative LOC100889806 [Strongylocentrotus purpuratus] n=1 Tax=Lepeophtheirus salmonis TaxID=72036 RepID=A0A0K2U868_LEPSM
MVQQIGQLPDIRMAKEQSPFECTSVDHFGPLSVKVSRNRSVEGQVVIFSYLTSRDIHLELTYDLCGGGKGLSSEKFLSAFRRFVTLRGIRAGIIYSDQWKNLVGAHKEIKKICDNWSELMKKWNSTN